MSRWIGTITDTGSSILDDSINGKGLSITKATFGTGTVDDVLLKQQTALVQEKQVAAITAKIKLSEGYKIGVETRANTEAYVANQIGMWGQVNGEGETYLVAIYQNKTGVQIPSSEEVADFLYTFYCVLAVKNDAKIEIQIDPNFTVSREVLDAAVEQLHTDIDAAVDEHNKSADAHEGVLAKAEDLKTKADLDDGGKLKKTQLPELATSDVTGLDNALKNVPAGNVHFIDGETFQEKLDSGELKGQDGKDGAPGKDGKDGAPGATGGIGPQGPEGEPGPKSDKIELTLAVGSWADKKQTASDPLLVMEGYNYIAGAAAGDANIEAFSNANIRCLDMTENGKITFVCDDPPEQEVKVRIIRIAANEAAGGRVINMSMGGGKIVKPEKLVITAQPSRTEYKVGDTFEPDGMSVELYYENGAHLTLDGSGYVITPSGALKEADEAVTVSYTEFGKTVSATVDIQVTRTEIPVPTQNNTLTYSGSAQQPTWEHYEATKMTKEGSESEVDAGTYTVTFTCNDAYTFPKGEHSKAVEWKIARAECEPSAKPVSVTLFPEHLSETITITRQGDGVISAQSMAPDIVGVSVAENVITVTSKGQQSGKADITVTVAQTKNYNEGTLVIPVNAAFTRVWGVMWDFSNSNTAMTRLTKGTDPNGLVTEGALSAEPQAAVGNTGGSSPFDEWLPWAGMEEYNIDAGGTKIKFGSDGFSRKDKDTLVFIPKYWFARKDDTSGKKICWYVADGPADGLEVHPGSDDYYARYELGPNNVSRSGVSPLTSITRATARSGCAGKGAGWQQRDMAAWCAYIILYIVEYADWNAQKKIGRGNVDSGSKINTGGTDAMSYHTGRAEGSDGYTAVQYRHIENPWGNVNEWVDGVNFNNGDVYVCLDPSKFKDDTETDYTKIGTKIQSNGFISELGVSENMPWAFFPSKVGGSDSTYIPDYASCNSGWRVLRVGGDYGSGSNAGVLYFYAGNGSSRSDSYIGSRLLYRDP